LTTAGSIPASENFRKEAAFEPPFSIQKKQGATGITTVAPYIAGQWGRGNNRLPG
jgi:hypothetical protein